MIPYFTWDFLRKSVTQVPLKNYTLEVSILQTKIWSELRCLRYNFWGEFLSLNFFWNFGRDLFAKFSNKSSLQKLYPWRLNSTNRFLPKFEMKLRCLGYDFWGTFVGYENPGILGKGTQEKPLVQKTNCQNNFELNSTITSF